MILFRELEFAIAAPYLPKNSGIKNAQQYKPFDFEKTAIDLPTADRKFKTKEELEAIAKKMDAQNKG